MLCSSTDHYDNAQKVLSGGAALERIRASRASFGSSVWEVWEKGRFNVGAAWLWGLMAICRKTPIGRGLG